MPAGGSARTVYYENTDDDKTVVKFSAGGRTVTSHSQTDSFGRKVFDELQLGTDFVSRQFVYHAGKVTAEHKTNAKVKSSATTQLVSQIILSNGTTLSYGYDAEERITSVVETYTVDDTPVTNTTLYTYDALGQLLTETVNGNVVNSMEYDNYGNIVEKNGKAYTYGNATWKDLLTGFDGKTIEYDAQGNPVKYLGHTLTWKKGRQLKSFDGNTYIYNANGIRTSKTIGEVKHTYTLDGTKILRETWAGNTLIPLYDNEDNVCGILYNNVPYYFVKNQQGDVIAIVDKDAQTVARYSYDAWGVPTVTLDTSDCQIADINPFRYRGYYYDKEIGLYYLQSRYFNPSISRFLIADEQIGFDLLNLNLFTYCKNDTIDSIDIYGYSRIMIDAGHGGKDDKGAMGYCIFRRWRSWAVCPTYVAMMYYEKDFNLNVAKEVRKLLRSAGHTVYMTRTTDVSKSLDSRYESANNNKVNYFVSIHHNSSHPFKKGYCVLYAGKHDILLSKGLANSISGSFAKNTKLKKYANPSANTTLAVLNGTKMPAVLVECGFMGGDLKYCRDNYTTIAYAIYKGIVDIIPKRAPDYYFL